ncbi:BgTH12-02168 [Blumeria graminis f. sp. triticale]|uniref:Bgt-2349 n=3 Tax=Blumeria graminis TaxID=34373 RepID=A0A381L634_BLUGR|nr:hypothetical protein BGT96224_2349 [Blumeria graminis f. sp. tritici 96224]CAD6501923.1 BgTH12-02168 [Blumeria graminis f. sp. triticale]VDB85874.1 Bgt-2349 [Blumeria graminis f. sp. tritici]
MSKRPREAYEFSSEDINTKALEEFEDSTTTVPEVRRVSSSAVLRSSKFVQLDSESKVNTFTAMSCSLPPHSQTFTFSSYSEYEVHYAKVHTNRCLECRRNFPTEHFLSLHIEENHDPLFSIKKERGDKMYKCFVEDCIRTCSTPQKRRMHLIDKHMFPKDYEFNIVNNGIGNRTSLLQNRRGRSESLTNPKNPSGIEKNNGKRHVVKGSLSKEGATNRTINSENVKIDHSLTSNTTEDLDMEHISKAMSALKFVPSTIKFGGRARAGFSRG